MARTARLLLISLWVFLGLCTGEAPAAPWPERPVRLIVPYAAGTGADLTARLLARDLEKVTYWPTVIENIPGGGGWTGWTALAKARPDGYTLGYLTLPQFYAGYLDPRRRQPEGIERFTPLLNHLEDPCVWAVKAQSPYRTLLALVEAALRSPGTLRIANHGAGSDDHLATLEMAQWAGLDLEVVHNLNPAASRAQLQDGQVAILGANVSELIQNHQSRELRVLGVMDSRRSPFLPDVPAFREWGYDLQWASRRGIAAPAGLPPETAAAITAVLGRVIASPAHRERLRQLGLVPAPLAGADYGALLKRDEGRVRTLMGW